VTEQSFEQMRRAMVASQLRTTGVNDPLVVAALGAVPRERFVPEGWRTLAYIDTLIRLESGRALNPPMVLGRLLNEARPKPCERSLVVGAATGYAAAVLAEIGLSVVSLEAEPSLAGQARIALGDAFRLVEGPLEEGWASGAPYDLILIDGAVEFVPDALIAQLCDGGRLATGFAERGVTRLAIGRRVGMGFGLTCFADAETALLPGFVRPRQFSF
jgi:protein-L-isoaspartate(D-aspartate) O-methyltransferase